MRIYVLKMMGTQRSFGETQDTHRIVGAFSSEEQADAAAHAYLDESNEFYSWDVHSVVLDENPVP